VCVCVCVCVCVWCVCVVCVCLVCVCLVCGSCSCACVGVSVLMCLCLCMLVGICVCWCMCVLEYVRMHVCISTPFCCVVTFCKKKNVLFIILLTVCALCLCIVVPFPNDDRNTALHFFAGHIFGNYEDTIALMVRVGVAPLLAVAISFL